MTPEKKPGMAPEGSPGKSTGRVPMRISLIVALAENGVIGRDGDLPWRLPDDLKRFKALTTGHHILMGRKTWASIGRALPNRTNLVLSRQRDFAAEGANVVHDMQTAIDTARRAGETELFIIGGEAVYKLALPVAHRLYLTRVHARIDGDVRFPPFDQKHFRLIERTVHAADEKHEHAFTFETLEREE